MFNISHINKILSEKTNITKPWWIILSWFSSKWQLLFCKWIIFSDKKISSNLEELFTQFVLPNKNIEIIVIDIVTSILEINDIKQLQNIDLLKEWLFVWDINNSNGSFILPNTKWINSIKQSIQLIKEKIKFSSKQVNIYKFQTKRFTIHK